MSIQLSRRRFLTGVGLVLAAPAIVQIGNIMPVRMVKFKFSKLITYSVNYDIEQRAWVIAGTMKINGPDWVVADRVSVGVSVENLADDFGCLEEGGPNNCPQAAVDHSKAVIEEAFARTEAAARLAA